MAPRPFTQPEKFQRNLEREYNLILTEKKIKYGIFLSMWEGATSCYKTKPSWSRRLPATFSPDARLGSGRTPRARSCPSPLPSCGPKPVRTGGPCASTHSQQVRNGDRGGNHGQREGGRVEDAEAQDVGNCWMLSCEQHRVVCVRWSFPVQAEMVVVWE